MLELYQDTLQDLLLETEGRAQQPPSSPMARSQPTASAPERKLEIRKDSKVRAVARQS